jgi:adenylate kinase
VQRTDDKRETVQERLAVYEAQTAPVIAYYQARGILSDVNGLGTVDEVHQRVVQVLSAHGLS